jgi:hypothetical protein
MCDTVMGCPGTWHRSRAGGTPADPRPSSCTTPMAYSSGPVIALAAPSPIALLAGLAATPVGIPSTQPVCAAIPKRRSPPARGCRRILCPTLVPAALAPTRPTTPSRSDIAGGGHNGDPRRPKTTGRPRANELRSALENVSDKEFEQNFRSSVKYIGSFLDQVGGRLGLDHDRVLMGRYAVPVVSRLLHLQGGRFADAAQIDRMLFCTSIPLSGAMPLS